MATSSKMWILSVIDRDTASTNSSIHTSRERALAYLAADCRGDWERQGHKGPIGKTDDESIDRYFEYWDDEMIWTLEELVVDPNPFEVDQSEEFSKLPTDEEFFPEDEQEKADA